MTLSSILIYVAIVGLLLARRFKGSPVTTPKKLFVLPVVVTVIGLQQFDHAKLSPVNLTVVVVGCLLSLVLGAGRGLVDRLSVRDGLPWVRWGGASLAVFAATFLTKIVVDVIGVAAGGSRTVLTTSLAFSLGLTLLGEAGVVWLRSGAMTGRPAFASRENR
jgi:hypothetical protein